MPGKHVHFAPHDQVFYFRDSPSESETSSLPSTPGPLTPPTLAYNVASSDIRVPGAVFINPILGYSPHPVVALDLRDHPSSTGLLSSQIAQPATKPSIPILRIICPHLPWEITVTASPSGVVTVGDILGGIYAALRTNVMQREFEDLPSSSHQRSASRAYLARCKRSKGRSIEGEKAQGLKRVDFLLDQTQWMGLASTSKGPDVWQLITS